MSAEPKLEGFPKEFAFYYPNHTWLSGSWIKNLILFFDGVALLLPRYMADRQDLEDPAIAAGLRQHGLLHTIEPESVVNQDATRELATAIGDILASGALDKLNDSGAFLELSMSRMGFGGDRELANFIFEELRERGLARESEDGVSIPVHRMVRSLFLVLLSQILRPCGKHLGADLSPATDRADLVNALTELLGIKAIPSAQSVIEFDMNAVGVNLASVPIDEVLDFRQQNLTAHRKYCLSIRRFAFELSQMEENDRAKAFAVRQAELDDISSDIRRRARIAWKKPSAFALSLSGAALALTGGHPLAAAFTVGASVLGFTPAASPQMGAYSYLFRAANRF